MRPTREDTMREQALIESLLKTYQYDYIDGNHGKGFVASIAIFPGASCLTIYLNVSKEELRKNRKLRKTVARWVATFREMGEPRK